MKTKHNVISIFIILCLAVLLAAAPAPLAAKQKTARGMVFDDANRNRIFDKGEQGIPGVVVSNQYQAVQTDEKGFFRLPVENETIIFVSKPAGYNVPLNENTFPQFYYIHQPAGSPAGLQYPGIAPTGKLPAMIYFPLYKAAAEESFDVIVMGDPQTATPEEIDFFRDSIVSGLVGTGARFYLALGDIMYNDLSYYDQMNRVVGQIGIPIHHVMGNHDMNFQVPDYIHEAETFKRIHGPDYYSFNYGKVHFIVLNTVKYFGWNTAKMKAGSYTGFVHERQLAWLKNDLSFVPQDHLVVLSMHIPVITDLYPKDETCQIMNRADFFKILESREHLLALAGHMHYVEYIEFTSTHGWNGKIIFPSLTAGAGCGTWWRGPRDPWGIPFGMCTDGAPNGYFLFSFKGNRYHYRFHAAASTPDAPGSQLRINSPTGTLSSQDLKDGKITINVNVFAGTPRATVTFTLDNGPEMPMERTVMNDPFFARLIETNKASYLDWMDPCFSAHTWTAPLPPGLGAGIHRLKATVTDRQGDVFTAYRLFEVANPKQQ
ncbi:MAG: calcineurin-like phosphoesterase family protein [Candidatus Aminicenantes bacterium]|nr:calcineurin-like phosphoesterase family protein [Candidatus Aminicenantes bacterium]